MIRVMLIESSVSDTDEFLRDEGFEVERLDDLAQVHRFDAVVTEPGHFILGPLNRAGLGIPILGSDNPYLVEILRSAPETKHKIIQRRDLSVDLTTETLFLKDQPVKLTRMEYLVMELLMTRKDRPIRQAEIIAITHSHIPAEIRPKGTNMVNVLIHRLRRRLPEGTIQNIWGQGYVIPTTA